MTTIPTVYADESGSTGENLADPAQPIFVSAAVVLDDATAADMVGRVIAVLPVGHGEPKYTSLAKTGVGRAALLQTLGTLSERNAYAYVVDKRFMIAAKMIDLLVENMMFKSGYNMYADGSAVALANLLHLTGPVLGSPDRYNDMLDSFVATLRRRNTQSVDDLYSSINAFLATADPQLREILGLLLSTKPEAESLVRAIADKTFDDVLEPVIPAVSALCFAVAEELGPFRLIHDNLKPLAAHVVEVLNQHLMPDPAHPGENLRALPVTSLDFGDSLAHPQLQIADWVAGAVRQVATMLLIRQVDQFAELLRPLTERWISDALWASPEMISTPRRL